MNCHSSGLPRSTWHFCHAQQRMVHFKKRQAFQCFRSFSSLKIRLSLWVLTFLGLFLGWHEAFATCWSSRLQQHWGWDTETLVMLGALWRFFGGYPGNPTQKSSIQPCWNAEYDPVTSAIFTPCLPCISMQRNCYDWRWCSAYMSGELPCLFGEEHEKSCYLQQNALCFIGLRHTPCSCWCLLFYFWATCGWDWWRLISTIWVAKWLRKCHWAPLKYNFQLHPWIQLPRSSRICHLEFQPHCPKV